MKIYIWLNTAMYGHKINITYKFGQQILEQTEHPHCVMMTDLISNTGSVNTVHVISEEKVSTHLLRNLLQQLYQVWAVSYFEVSGLQKRHNFITLCA